ncbi:MAG: RtcB family protein [Thermoflexibacter sp.]
MSKKLNNNELRAIGFYSEALLEQAGRFAKNLIKNKILGKEEILAKYRALISNPDSFASDAIFAEIAQLVKELQPIEDTEGHKATTFELKKEVPEYKIYGIENIDKEAIKQMDNAMRLPITLAGSLMPDAHVGYGLPIGGVLATNANAVIPYAVGVDIACRMCLSVFEMDNHYLEQKSQMLKNFLVENTLFGIDGRFAKPMPDEVFDKPEWNATKIIKDLRHKAEMQIGTSGTGNHFVEWGILEISKESEDLKLPIGKYLALLSHSGSRGFGASIANYYSKLAMDKTKLPKEAKHLAWLDLETEEGQAYWIAMNLAGDYASANHHQIHKKMAKSLGIKPLLMVENHHNFAWEEKLADGTPVIVHRKGATPAGKGDLGIIPGSMAQAGFVVKGKGDFSAIYSASHGAGRLMSRAQAMKNITKQDIKKVLADKGVILIGGDLDEAPMVYKDIYKVLESQNDLVEILAKFTPKIVRMADPDPKGRRED